MRLARESSHILKPQLPGPSASFLPLLRISLFCRPNYFSTPTAPPPPPPTHSITDIQRYRSKTDLLHQTISHTHLTHTTQKLRTHTTNMYGKWHCTRNRKCAYIQIEMELLWLPSLSFSQLTPVVKFWYCAKLIFVHPRNLFHTFLHLTVTQTCPWKSGKPNSINYIQAKAFTCKVDCLILLPFHKATAIFWHKPNVVC
jgi:hypothetical protein